MRSFLEGLERGLGLAKAHPDFVAIALLALILGLGRAPGIASAVSIRAAMSRPPAIENVFPEFPAGFDVKVRQHLPQCDRDFVILPSY